MLWVVWIAVVVLSLVVLGVIGYGLLGAFGRLARELQAAERDVRPVLEQAQGAAARAAALQGERRANDA
ncbi:hypothetical protein SAMN05660359_00511 [Geodermatophilus obscurus]|uniref:Uncharacterized protein n=1 Tax=Geodermatophilus obscurus TaxID=1861 RepID=A0A1I5CTF7_9ACTN|nr:hypothetical protein [Geodermatophilus obscurus]SFN89941.1 hypothetical protein SAMN05660359_00511 [Geodermatophilus obscurus]